VKTTLLVLSVALLCLVAGLAAADLDPTRWEEKIAAYEAEDAEAPPPTGEVLFVGSSSIVSWKTDDLFPDFVTLNRGFGGSTIADSLYYADRIILPYEPRTIVLYAGDNDIAAGSEPEAVRDDFVTLVEKVHEALPETRILYISIKPSVARWEFREPMSIANDLIRKVVGEDERLYYVDIWGPMLDENGEPRPDLLQDDGLHLNAEGYDLWTEIVTPVLKQADEDRENTPEEAGTEGVEGETEREAAAE